MTPFTSSGNFSMHLIFAITAVACQWNRVVT